ncbi:unnamed protein product [Nesidiocoris tenuis]|uniref:Uncharacterized protein n=1 Tax=Nesidiocoris tenuis TaxID=355587 RepID=A0A6H5G301_9HEMI|nr:unnamed protein product [Nesidiocoris tenuis]
MGENGELTPVVGMKGAVGSAAVSMASVSSSSQEATACYASNVRAPSDIMYHSRSIFVYYEYMSSSSTTTSSSRVAKTSHSQKFLTSSEMKASTVKSDLSELKSSISEMKNLSSAAFGRSVRSSLEDLCGVGGGEDDGGGGPEPLVTFPPDSDTSPPIGSPLGSQIGSQIGSPLGSPLGSPNSDLTAASSNTSMKFEKRVHSASNTKVSFESISVKWCLLPN